MIRSESCRCFQTIPLYPQSVVNLFFTSTVDTKIISRLQIRSSKLEHKHKSSHKLDGLNHLGRPIRFFAAIYLNIISRTFWKFSVPTLWEMLIHIRAGKAALKILKGMPIFFEITIRCYIMKIADTGYHQAIHSQDWY